MDASLEMPRGNWVRALLRRKLEERGAICTAKRARKFKSNVCALCRDGPCTAWPLGERVPTLWETLVSSTFCLEPAGDTLTRSHLYLAMLSGCVPVLFEGGHDSFDSHVQTYWAWRSHDDGEPPFDTDAGFVGSSSAKPRLHFRDFAVVLNSSAVRDGTVDVVEHLLGMSPAVLLALRRGLDRAAPAMRYAADLQTSQGEATDDAFARFVATLKERLEHTRAA